MKVRAHDAMTGEELRTWRLQQAGSHGRHGEREGWSRTKAAEWYGVTHRSWERYEMGDRAIPQSLVRRIKAYEASFEKTIDQIFDTSERQLEKWGSPFPELAHEFNEGGDEQPEEEGHE